MKLLILIIIIFALACSSAKEVQEFNESLEYDSTWEGNRL